MRRQSRWMSDGVSCWMSDGSARAPAPASAPCSFLCSWSWVWSWSPSDRRRRVARPQLLGQRRDRQVRAQRSDAAPFDVVEDGVGKPHPGALGRDAGELRDVLADEDRLKPRDAVADRETPNLGGRMEQLGVEPDDEVANSPAAADLLPGLHRGPHDVVAEEGAEVATCQQGVHVAIERCSCLCD